MYDMLPSRRRRWTRKSFVLAAVGTLLVGTAGGAAYAAWAVTASGSSQAGSGAPVAGLVVVATPTATLYPGGSTGLFFTVTNPNSFPVTYTAATFGAVTVDNATACPASNITVANQVLSIPLAAGVTSTVQSPAGAISMVSSAPNGCQNRTFTVATTLTGASG